MSVQNHSYKTGTYLFISRKIWKCECCNDYMPIGEKVFTRIKCFGPFKKNKYGESYQEKTYNRFHLKCALSLTDLNEEEHIILGEYFKTVKTQEKKEESII